MANKPDKIHILLADDHAVVREGLKALIQAEPDMTVVGEAGDGSSVLNLVGKLSPDVVVMDLSMPNLNGVAATQQLKQTAPKVRVLALTVHEDYSYMEELLLLGASGYVLKRAARNELIEAIRAVAKGDTYIDRHVAGAVVKTLVNERRPGPRSSESSLTPRELSVAKHIARGYTNKEIAASLNLSVKTIETHKANCMQKLGLRSRAELVRYACDQGWLMQAPEGPQGLP